MKKLPHGYKTNVGELGNKFSGGERQRLSIGMNFNFILSFKKKIIP